MYDNDRYWQPVLIKLKNLHASGRLLDIGCAFGYFLKRAKPFFSEVYGADISEYALEKAQKQVPQGKFSVVNLDTDDLPFPDDNFDVITAFDVLEHTKSIPNSLAKIKAKLKPGGYLIFSVPVTDTWAGWLFHKFDKDITHISVPTTRELDEFISHSGMTLVEKQGFLNAAYIRIPFLPVSYEVTLKK